jgi:hypothetical protein
MKFSIGVTVVCMQVRQSSVANDCVAELGAVARPQEIGGIGSSPPL